MLIIYRISEMKVDVNCKVLTSGGKEGYLLRRPPFITNEACLKNFTYVFNKDIELKVIADNLEQSTTDMVHKYVDPKNVEHVSVGSGHGTFNLALDMALKQTEHKNVYFVENDYLHSPNAYVILNEGFDRGFKYITLYDHPDKYKQPDRGGNPLCEEGGEFTKVFMSHNRHWKITNSTTMTFATNIKQLKNDEEILRKWTVHEVASKQAYWDMSMWLDLAKTNNSTIACCIPGVATHGDTLYLGKFIDWKKVLELTNKETVL